MWNEHGDGSIYGKQYTEILLNRTKNSYFSMNAYLANDSWAKEVFVLNGIDKRLVAARNLEHAPGYGL